MQYLFQYPPKIQSKMVIIHHSLEAYLGLCVPTAYTPTWKSLSNDLCFAGAMVFILQRDFLSGNLVFSWRFEQEIPNSKAIIQYLSESHLDELLLLFCSKYFCSM